MVDQRMTSSRPGYNLCLDSSDEQMNVIYETFQKHNQNEIGKSTPVLKVCV